MTFGAQKEKAKNIWAQNIMVIALSEHLNSCRRGGKHMIFQKGVRGSVDVKCGSRKMDQIYCIYTVCTVHYSVAMRKPNARVK